MAGAAGGASALAGGGVSTPPRSGLGRFPGASAAGKMARAGNAAGGHAKGKVGPPAAAARGALFPSTVGRSAPPSGGAPRTPPGGAATAPKPNTAGGGNERAEPQSGSDGDRTPSANDGGGASGAPTVSETAQDTQAQPPGPE